MLCKNTFPRLNMAGKFLQLILLVLIFTGDLFAQAFPGIVTGTVMKQGENPLEGVRVSLQTEGGFQIMVSQTDRSGRFMFSGIQPGTYTIEFSMAGWKTKHFTGLQIPAAGIQDVRIVLVSNESNAVETAQTSRRDVQLGGQFGEVALREFPNTQRVSSILENQEFSAVTEPLDLGGLETGIIPFFSALGNSWTENEYNLNGFNITDPYFSGRPLLDPDLSALSQIDITSASKPSSIAISGGNVELNTPVIETTERLHGSAQLFYSNGSLQSDNMDSHLESLHFPGPERLKQLFDGNLRLTGKLTATKLPFFLSISTQNLSKTIGGFPIETTGNSYNVLAAITPFQSNQTRLDLLYSGQHISNSNEGASPQVSPSATTQGRQNSNVFQAQWQRSAT